MYGWLEPNDGAVGCGWLQPSHDIGLIVIGVALHAICAPSGP